MWIMINCTIVAVFSPLLLIVSLYTFGYLFSCLHEPGSVVIWDKLYQLRSDLREGLLSNEPNSTNSSIQIFSFSFSKTRDSMGKLANWISYVGATSLVVGNSCGSPEILAWAEVIAPFTKFGTDSPFTLGNSNWVCLWVAVVIIVEGVIGRGTTWSVAGWAGSSIESCFVTSAVTKGRSEGGVCVWGGGGGGLLHFSANVGQFVLSRYRNIIQYFKHAL